MHGMASGFRVRRKRRQPTHNQNKHMKKILSIIGLAAATLAGIQAQTIWNYDFGTGSGTFNTASSASTTFLPTPPVNGGTARVRVGSGGGSFNLENPGSSLGSGSELRIVAPTSTSVNKFSIYDYISAATTFSISYDLRLSGGDSGTFYFFMGDGTTFSDNSGFNGSQVFTGIQWQYGASGAIITNVRNGGNWVTTGLSGTPFAQDTNYTVQVIGNNSASSINYNQGGVNTLAANTWDLWIGGTKVGNNLAKAQLADAANIDSFMFYGINSTGNVANLTVDNISYANYAVPEPQTWFLIGLGAAIGLWNLRRRRVAGV